MISVKDIDIEQTVDVFVGNEQVIDDQKPKTVNESDIMIDNPEPITVDELAPILSDLSPSTTFIPILSNNDLTPGR